MEQPVDRYEFRAFSRNFGIVETRLRQLARVDRVVESVDTYLLVDADDYVIKLRDGLLDIKRLINRSNGLEQWSPLLKTGLPIYDPTQLQQLRQVLAVDETRHNTEADSALDFMRALMTANSAMRLAEVYKQRWILNHEECLCEIAEININGAWLQTVCIESENPDAVSSFIHTLALHNHSNENYLQLIRRVLGMLPGEDILRRALGKSS